MNRLLSTCVVVALAVSACSKSERPAWPNGQPEIDTLKLKDGVVAVPPAVTNKAKVKKDALAFPADMADQVRADWPTGKVIVGQPAEDKASRAQNPFGFLRKVKSVDVVGDEVVVITEPAKLDEVLTGQFRKNLDFSSLGDVDLPEDTDLSAYDVVLHTEEAPPFPVLRPDGGVDEQPLHSGGAGTSYNQLFGRRRDAVTLSPVKLEAPATPINLFSFSNKRWVPPGRPELELKLSGNMDFTPILSLSPSLFIDYDWNEWKFRLEEFEFTAGVTGKVGLRTDTTISVLPVNPNLPLDQVLLATKLMAHGGLKQPIPRVPIAQKLRAGTLGPIPIVARASAFLECSDAVLRGSARISAVAELGLNPRAGVHYTHKNGWEPVLDTPVTNPTYTLDVSGNNAAFSMDCGVYVRVEVLVAGVAGPYAQARRSVIIEAERKDVCNDHAQDNHQATDHSQVDLKMFDALQVGAEADLLVTSIEYGPYDLWRQNYATLPGEMVKNPIYRPDVWWFGPEYIREYKWVPISSWTKDRVGQGATQCKVTCADGVKTAGEETDVDCGGPYCRPCKKGKACATGRDCNSGTCLPGNTCQGAPCDDDVKGQEETDVDCGGSACGKCGAGKGCLADRDCQSGVCGGNGQCVASLCEDGVVSGKETDVDCGGPSCRPCADDKVCAADGDCGSGLCSNDGVTPRTCTQNLCRDGQRSGTEGDVDCGASEGCTRLCAVDQGCNSDADCASGACNLSRHVCAPDACHDGRADRGETDLDCGGPCQAKCGVGQACDYGAHGNADCASGICANDNVCVADTCHNRRVDADEVGTDCAGACAARCPLNETCRQPTDCVTNTTCHPLRLRCQLPGCDDGLKNGQESAIDCGGPTCSKCAASKACNTDSDCVTNLCSGGRCLTSRCENGVKDTDEADVDCGGTACPAFGCGQGKACAKDGDCASHMCANNVCVSDPCLDRVRNGAETDVDCGGGTCAARCAKGAQCVTGADCASGQCSPTTNRCVGSACEDGVKGGTETDVDCGGSTCSARCAVNQACASSADCASGVCNGVTKRCVPSACFDGQKNGTETDVDCGGACDARCGFDRACAANQDCQSGACTASSRCAADQCSDGKLNGYESAVDCGGTCASKCAVGQGCSTGADCAHPQGLVGVPGYCAIAAHTCSASSCTTGLKDGDETDVDCGGSCGACALTKACVTGADCQSGICHASRKTCSANQQDDGLKNGDETDIDCGGTVALGCLTAQACADPMDCRFGYCSVNGLCLDPYPRTCTEARQFGVLTTNGLVTIDPDGPRQLTTSGPGAGFNHPMTTWCWNATIPNDPVSPGWTAVYMQNSESNITSFANQTDPLYNTSGYWTKQACRTDTDCTAKNPNDRCRQTNARGPCPAAGGYCYCQSDEPLPEALFPPTVRMDPAYLSVSQPQMRDRASFAYELAKRATPTIGFGHPNGFNAQIFRWTAYRNGVQVFDSGPFTEDDIGDNWARGWATGYYTLHPGNGAGASLVTGRPNGPLWCQNNTLATAGSMQQPSMNYFQPGLGFTFGLPPYPYSDSVTQGPSPQTERCYEVATTPIGGFPPSTTAARQGIANIAFINFVTFARPFATAATSNYRGYIGMWWGSYGQGGNGGYPYSNPWESPPISSYLGICNGLGNSLATQGQPCQAYHHTRAQTFQWFTGETNMDPAYGSVFEAGVPGLVFVLWAH